MAKLNVDIVTPERRLVSTAADECILLYVRVDGTGARTVAITPEKNLWVGGTSNSVHNLLDGTTGRILDTIRPPCGGYGGLIDAQTGPPLASVRPRRPTSAPIRAASLSTSGGTALSQSFARLNMANSPERSTVPQFR